MINETIKTVFVKDFGEFGTGLIIETERGYYKISPNGFGIIEVSELAGYYKYTEDQLSGLKILEVGTDGFYLLIKLSDKRFITYYWNCSILEIEPEEEYDDNNSWLQTDMQKLSLENNYRPYK